MSKSSLGVYRHGRTEACNMGNPYPGSNRAFDLSTTSILMSMEVLGGGGRFALMQTRMYVLALVGCACIRK